jgi:hypothetical protein
MVVTQTYSGTMEPYTVSFYTTRDRQDWDWYYIDHEDLYWWGGRIKLQADASRAVIYKGRARAAEYDMTEGTLRFLKRDRFIPGPQRLIRYESPLPEGELPESPGRAFTEISQDPR